MSDGVRNKRRAPFLLVYLFLGLTNSMLVSCAPKTRTIEGSVFVVTNTRDNIKLANVEVNFRSDKEIDTFLSEFLPKELKKLEDLKSLISIGKKAEADWMTKASAHKSDIENITASIKSKKKEMDVQAPQENDNEIESLLKEKEEIENEISKDSDKIRYYKTTFSKQIDDVSTRIKYLEDILWREKSKLRASSEPEPNIPEIPSLQEQLATMNQEKNLNIRALTREITSLSEKLRQLNIFLGEKQKEFSHLQKENEKIRLELEKKRNEAAKNIEVLEESLKQHEKELKAVTSELDTLNKGNILMRSLLSNINEVFQQTLFKELPPCALSTRTDGDGKFEIEIPYEGKFTVSVFCERKVTSELTEKYFWLIHLPERDRSKDKFFNLFFIPFKRIASDKFNLTPSNRIGSTDEHCAVKLLQPD